MAAVVEEYEALVGDVFEDRDRDLERQHPIVAVDQEDGRLDAGGRTRVYAGMRTFISVMPWIRFE